MAFKRGVGTISIIAIVSAMAIILVIIIIILSSLDITGNAIRFFKKKAPIQPPILITDGTGINGSYYDSQDFTNLKFTRIDPNVNFTYGTGSPDPSIAPDSFSIRWEGYVIPSYSELYTFYTYSNDGMRIYLNDQLIVTDWSNHAARENSSLPIALIAGRPYIIKIEYYEGSNSAEVQARWSSTSQAKQVIPQSALRNSLDTGRDTTPPTVAITSPLDNSYVSGMVTINADATDNVKISYVQFFIGNSYLLGTDSTPPYSITTDSTKTEDQTALIFATAGDNASIPHNRATSDKIRITIANALLPPQTPSGLAAVPVSSSQINISWNNVANETAFVLERSLSATSGFTQIVSLGLNSLNYKNTNLNPDTTYYYRIKAINLKGESTYSSVVSATTPPPVITAQCENGLDDDNDGLIDYPADPGCTNVNDNDERNIVTTCVKPDATNTGPSNPSLLQTYTGPLTITQNGAIIQNAIITGQITIQADNVIIRNFRIFADGNYYGVRATNGNKGLLIEDGEIIGAGIGDQINGAGIYGGGFTARRVNIRESKGDGLKPNNNDVVVENSWIHHLGTATSAHADGVQIRKGINYTFRCNNFDMPKGLTGYHSNSPIFTQSAEGPVDNVIIDSNWINGGNFGIHTDTGITNIFVKNNLWGNDCKYGLLDGPVTTWEDNIWEATGETITLSQATNRAGTYCDEGA